MRKLIFCSVLLVFLAGLNVGAQTYNCAPPSMACTAPLPACMSTFTAQGNGNWSTLNTWATTRLPGFAQNDCVVIGSGYTVTYDVTSLPQYPIAQVIIKGGGKLRFKTDGQPTDTYQLKTYFIGVADDGAGTLEIGKPDPPLSNQFPSKAVISLIGLPRPCYTQSNDDYQPCNGGLQVAGGGTWTTKITATLTYQVPLPAELTAGVSSITFSGDVTSIWTAGDLWVITSTEFSLGSCPTCTSDTGCMVDENELLLINTVSYDMTHNVTTVQFARQAPMPGSGTALLYRHKSINNTIPKDKIPSQVGKINRTITIQTDPSSTETVVVQGQNQVRLLPSHTVVSPTAANVQLSDVEFYNLGVSDAVQIPGFTALNLYAMHMHNTYKDPATGQRSS